MRPYYSRHYTIKRRIPVNAIEFGAKGDGKTDNTAALQSAIDAAAPTQGTVHIPAGIYPCGKLKMHDHVCLEGEPSWSFHEFGGTILRFNDPAADCMIDVSDTYGARLSGLCLDGSGITSDAHGVLAAHKQKPAHEHSVTIDRCRISNFGGDGARLLSTWVFILSHTMLSHNKGDALRVTGCDGLVHDCWFSGNGGAGIAGHDCVGNTTFTGNRVEWNKKGGIILCGASHYNIPGNYIDRCGGPGIRLAAGHGQPCVIATVTGNVVNRCGATEWGELPEEEKCQMLFTDVRGLSCMANTMAVARSDRAKGTWSPDYGIVIERLSDSVISGNVMHLGALKQLLLDKGGHGENVTLRDNVGSIFRPGIDVLRTWI